MLDRPYLAQLLGNTDEKDKAWSKIAERELASQQGPARRVQSPTFLLAMRLRSGYASF